MRKPLKDRLADRILILSVQHPDVARKVYKALAWLRSPSS
jgi:hypothetical protein